MSFRATDQREELKKALVQQADAMEDNPHVGYSIMNSGPYMVIILRRPGP